MHLKLFSVLIVLTLLVSCASTDNSSRYSQTSNYQERQNAGQKPLPSISHKWKKEKVDTTAGIRYLSDTEKQVIMEINMVRTNPAEYARSVLVPLRSYYRNKLLHYPGEIEVATNEGLRAVDECIRRLKAAKPLPPLYPQKGLSLAARDHVRDQARTGDMGHTGSDKSTLLKRITRYGTWNSTVGENIDYGHRDARRIVTSLLIDDGVRSRGHRENLLDSKFKFVGVSVGAHKLYDHMCVMDFAGSYQTK